MKPIKASALESELARQLKDSSGSSPRAMAATVVIAVSASEADAADTLVDELMGLRPARVLHLRTGAEETRAWTAARCALDRQNRGVCFEDLYLEAPGIQALDPLTWGTLAIRELPTILLWTLPVEELLARAVDYAERVDLFMIDPGPRRTTGEDEKSGAEKILALSAYRPIADLGWERLGRLRAASAQLFDGATEALEDLSSVRATAPDPWTLALFEGWLASRLGWKGGRGGWRNRQDEPVSFAPLQGKEGKSPCEGAEFTLSTGVSATVSCGGSNSILLKRPDGSVTEHPSPPLRVGSSIARFIDAPMADPLYLEALRALVDLPDR